MNPPPADGARIDLYTAIHKALRLVMFETTTAVARADFDAPGVVQEMGSLLGRCFAFLREHGDHEDAEVTPVLARLDSALARSLAAEHVALDKAAIAVESLVPRIAGSAGLERPAMVNELLRRLYLCVADQLRHLDREEREANPVLWANLPPSQLAEIRTRILARMSPARLSEWAALLVAALTPAELAHMRA